MAKMVKMVKFVKKSKKLKSTKNNTYRLFFDIFDVVRNVTNFSTFPSMNTGQNHHSEFPSNALGQFTPVVFDILSPVLGTDRRYQSNWTEVEEVILSNFNGVFTNWQV